MLCYAMLCYAMLCYAMLCYAMLCYAMLCYAMLCYAMLCYAMLCRAVVLCCVVLCCVMLCYAAPCCVVMKCHVVMLHTHRNMREVGDGDLRHEPLIALPLDAGPYGRVWGRIPSLPQVDVQLADAAAVHVVPKAQALAVLWSDDCALQTSVGAGADERCFQEEVVTLKQVLHEDRRT